MRQRHRFQLLPRLLILGTFIIAVAIGVSSSFGLAQDRPQVALATALDQKLIDDALVGSEIMSNLAHLSDVIGPRLTGSANLKRANDWAAEKMTAYGLTNVQLEPWELPVGWERGTATARMIEPNTGRSLTVAARGWSPGTNGKIVGRVVVIDAKTTEELAKYEGKLKDAIILQRPPSDVRPITEGMDISTGPRSGTPANEKGKAEPAAEKGNAQNEKAKGRGGFNNRNPGESMRFGRELSEFLKKEGAAVLLSDAAKPHGLMNMTGNWRGNDRVAASDPLPALFVAHEHYAMLHRLATRPEPAETKIEVEITNTFVPGPLAVYNTIGEIRGSEKPDEFVVVGAHIDSWDLGQGTTDNGTGTCVVLEAARLLSKCGVKPRRTIRFCLFSGEEQGLHGSKAYVKRHQAEMANTSAAVVHDIGTGRVVGVSLMGREVLQPIMEAELASLKAIGVTGINADPMFGSDHQSFESAGVPGFMFRQDPAEYRLTHHSQSDTFDKAREPDLVQGAQTMSVIAMRLANRDELLPRAKKAAAPAEDSKAPAKKDG